jgi:hypothetical protein
MVEAVTTLEQSREATLLNAVLARTRIKFGSDIGKGLKEYNARRTMIPAKILFDLMSPWPRRHLTRSRTEASAYAAIRGMEVPRQHLRLNARSTIV